MGVPKFFKEIVKQIDGAKTSNIKNPFSLLCDLNGLIHRVAGSIFGYGKTLLGEDIPISEKLEIRKLLKKKAGFEILKTKFLMTIGPTLTEVIIKGISPTDILILTLDGIPPLAKVNQQRMRRFRSGFDRLNPEFEEDMIPTDEQFDTAYLTAGTQFMRDVSEQINIWIMANIDSLPKFTVFSDSDISGEGEHKIFRIFENDVKRYILENLSVSIKTEKDKDKIFRQLNHIVYGLDADLCFLSMMRDYNFIWVREQYSIKKINEGYLIDVIRNHFIESMKPEDFILTEEQKFNIINDFVLISFFIGDDFVPSMFTISFSINKAINGIMEKYKEFLSEGGEGEGGKTLKFLTTKSDINFDVFSKFLLKLVSYEEELYNYMKMVNEKEINGKSEEIIKLRNDNFVNISDVYIPSTILVNYDYIQCVTIWKEIIVRPSLIGTRYNQNNKIDSLLRISESSKDSTMDLCCQNYLTGLQWNLKYYMGFNINNWYYKYTFAPCIYNIFEFIRSGKFKKENVMRMPDDPKLNVTQVLAVVLNPYFSKPVLKTFFGDKDTKYNSATSRCKIWSSYFPSKITFSLQGKYKSESHSKIPLIPEILPEDIFSITKISNEISKENINWNMGKLEPTFEYNFKEGSIRFGRNEITTIENRDEIKKGDKEDKNTRMEGNTFSGRERGDRGDRERSQSPGRGRGGRGDRERSQSPSRERGDRGDRERSQSPSRGRGGRGNEGRSQSSGRGRGRGRGDRERSQNMGREGNYKIGKFRDLHTNEL
jgi:hypothetical protein